MDQNGNNANRNKTSGSGRNGASKSGGNGRRSNSRRSNSGRSSKKSNGRNSRRRNSSSSKKRIDPKKIWGDAALLDENDSPLNIADDPSALTKSLGQAPLSGHQNVSEHYFAAIYDRAVGLAAALAAAGDLIEPDELT